MNDQLLTKLDQIASRDMASEVERAAAHAELASLRDQISCPVQLAYVDGLKDQIVARQELAK